MLSSSAVYVISTAYAVMGSNVVFKSAFIPFHCSIYMGVVFITVLFARRRNISHLYGFKSDVSRYVSSFIALFAMLAIIALTFFQFPKGTFERHVD
jgi:uncharacterized PurR-regulated membrane protein YhhQ (DUF165 family)